MVKREIGHRQPPIVKVSTYVRTEKKTGRNELCPCGSGKKYKKCCGVQAQEEGNDGK